MIRIRCARPGEGSVVAERIRASLPASLAGLTIWHCGRVDRWVETRIAQRASSFFYLAVAGEEQIVGVAEFRVIDDTAFLNQIGVGPSGRGNGIGTKLLAGGLHDLAASRALEVVALDVEPANQRAYEWYQRLGFVSCSSAHWMLLTRRPETAVARASIEGWEQAQREQALFGFSRFRLRTPRGAYDAGRLGDTLFRLTAVEAWRDLSVHAALRGLDPERRLLLIADSPIGGSQPVRHTERMQSPLERVLSKLPAA